MISLRQLLVIALVTAGIWLLKHLQNRILAQRGAAQRDAAQRDAARRNTAGAEVDYQDMVRCQQCGVHIPRAQAAGDERRGYRCLEADCATRHSPANGSA